MVFSSFALLGFVEAWDPVGSSASAAPSMVNIVDRGAARYWGESVIARL
jgi:hypothetical protein